MVAPWSLTGGFAVAPKQHRGQLKVFPRLLLGGSVLAPLWFRSRPAAFKVASLLFNGACPVAPWCFFTISCSAAAARLVEPIAYFE